MQIKRGDIISVGRHIFACGDIETGDLDSFAAWLKANLVRPEMVYTSPPRSDDNANLDQLEKVFDSIEELGPDLVFMEHVSHKKLSYELNLVGHRVGFWHECTWKTLSDATALKMFSSYAMRRKGYSVDNGFDPSKPRDTANYVFEQHAISGETVFDPYVGSGTMVRMAHDHDMQCIGFDEDQKLLEQAIDKMAKLTGETPCVAAQFPIG